VRIVREHGYTTINFGENTFAHPIFDWPEWFRRNGYNWRDFRIARIEFELDDVIPGWEFTLILWGVGFRFRRNWDMERTPQGRRMKGLLDSIEDGTARTRPWRSIIDDASVDNDFEQE
jgi:hypothetical protein